jgi:hypothetical protein
MCFCEHRITLLRIAPEGFEIKMRKSGMELGGVPVFRLTFGVWGLRNLQTGLADL